MINVFFIADKSEVKSISFAGAVTTCVVDGRLKLIDEIDNTIAEFANGKWVMWELPNAHKGGITK